MKTMRASAPVKILVPLLIIAVIAVFCIFIFRPSSTSSSVPPGSRHQATMTSQGSSQKQLSSGPSSGPGGVGQRQPQQQDQLKDANRPGAVQRSQAESREAGTMIDARSDGCRKRHYRSSTSKYSASLIVDLSSVTDMDQLMTTIGTLLKGAEQLVDEIVIAAENGVTSSQLQQAEAFLSTFNDVPSRKVVANAGLGSIAARSKVYLETSSEIFVFTDTSVVGTVGWLKPLIAALLSNPGAIVVPHYDDASNPKLYVSTSDQTVAQYSWPLTSRVMERLGAMPTTKGLYQSPTVRGNIFAVRRNFFDRIGGYDVRLPSDSAAAHLELSIRSWMCGGAIYVADCSHVGVRGVKDPVYVTDEKSVNLLGDLWFGNRKRILVTTSGFDVEAESDGTGKEKRKRHVGPAGSCRNIDVYFNEVARVPVPSPDAVYFGQLQAKTDRCAHAHLSDSRIDLSHCWPAGRLNLSSMVFELMGNGRLTTGHGRCLTVQRNSYIILDACSTTLLEQQRWTYDGVRLVNPWSDFCAMHVTDPENLASSMRQIVMAQNCTADLVKMKLIESKDNQFLGWKFVNP